MISGVTLRPSWRVRLHVLAGVFAVATANVVAAPAPGTAAPREQAEAFFETVIGGDTAKAVDTLLDGSTIRANRPEAASALKQQLAASLRTYGKPVGFDLVDSKVFGTSLVRLVYALKLEKYPLTFEFFFYGSGRSFLPIDLHFNDKLDVYRYDRIPAATDAASPP